MAIHAFPKFIQEAFARAGWDQVHTVTSTEWFDEWAADQHIADGDSFIYDFGEGNLFELQYVDDGRNDIHPLCLVPYTVN